MSQAEIEALEREIYERTLKLHELRAAAAPQHTEVADYSFATLQGDTTLKQLFGTQSRLMVIHNMGQACRYCTLWADGINGLLPHLEAAMSVVLVSKDDPETQRRFANSRGWRFRLASHGAGTYIREQSVLSGQQNMPGAVVYTLVDGQIRRRGSGVFGPGDLYCAHWNLLALAGLTVKPSARRNFNYWLRPRVPGRRRRQYSGVDHL